ncbi:MAG: hypothetical protein ACXWMG_00420 [Candidatus Limnocylindria bacterium]
MRHLRPYLTLFAIAALTVACSSSPGSSSGGASQGSQGSQPSQAAASSGGGGGGGGSLSGHGTMSYEITGDVTQSGDLNFVFINGGLSVFDADGWVGYFYSEDQQTVVQLNTKPGQGGVNFGDGKILVIGVDGQGCTFDFSKNDASGIKGTIDCPTTALATKVDTGGQINVTFHATVDAHT